jgi:hypothetical protein
MRRLAALLVMLACAASLRAGPARASQARAPDGVAIVVAALETALASGRVDAFRALTSPTLPPDEASAFEGAAFRERQTGAVVRERDRIPTATSTQVLVEMLIDRSGRGSLATWEIDLRPARAAGGGDRYEIAGLRRIAAIEGLHRLALDVSAEYRVKDFAFTAPDFTLTMASGVAFRATTDEGVTALVLRGSGQMRFSPPDEAERGQLVIFARKPDLVLPLDTAFIRVSPKEFSTRTSAGSLVPMAVNNQDANRAAAVFDDRGRHAYHVGLGDLSSDNRWSLLPPAGDMLIEMQTPRYGWLSYARIASDPEDISLFDRQARKNISVYASAERLRSRGRFYSEDDDLRYGVEHQDLDVRLDPDRSWISGRATLRLKVLQDGVTTLAVRLAESLTVQSVTSPELGRLLSLRSVGQNVFIVSLPVAAPRGAMFTVTIVYSGRLVPLPLDREAIGVDRDGQDAAVDPALLETEPLFAYSNRSFWYPQAAASDFGTATMTLRVPARYQVVATGVMTGSADTPIAGVARGITPDVERAVRFQTDRPVRYLACVISRLLSAGQARAAVRAIAPASDLASDERSPATLPAVTIDVVANPRQTSSAKSLASRAAAIVTFYGSILGNAPYPGFTLAAVDATLPGGHSPAYFAVLNQPVAGTPPSAWHDDPVAFNDVASFFLAHETAHQWWGQAIGAKNYHEQWLSEGLAQYFALLYTGASRGADAARDVLARMRESAMTYAAAGPIYLGYRVGHVNGNTRAFRAILYNKSAVVLHMLRRLIGDDAFTAGLRRYYREQRFRKAGTEDLRFAFEIEAHRPLARFFDQWILGSAIPKLRVSTRVEPSGNAAVVHVEQLAGVFDVPVTLIVAYADGRIEPVTVAVSQATENQRIALTGKIKRISVDEALTLADFVK